MDTRLTPDRRHDLRVVGLVAGIATWWVLLEPLTRVITRATPLTTAISRSIVTAVPLALTAVAILVLSRRSRRREEDAVRREALAAAELRRAQHLREAFLQGVSHELRTPLTSVVGFAETLRDHVDRLEPAALRLLADRLHANARRLERLVGGLTDVESLTASLSDSAEPSDLGRIVRRAVANLDHRMHQVTVTVADEHTLLRLDRDRIHRLVEELVGNAIRHTPPGSVVEVTVFTQDESVVLIVDDDGRGVDELAVDVLFDPFHQDLLPGEGHAPGLGIGLTLVERYARLHGGSTWCETSPLGGARFGVRFPVHGDPVDLDRWPGDVRSR